MLEKLRWLAEASVLQQSITYGDYTAQLIESTLYDPNTKSLNVDPNTSDALKQRALSAMKWNPILARNVVLLAMRHAIADYHNGAPAANAVQYSQTYYAFGLKDFATPEGCAGSADAIHDLTMLFPNWKFGYWVTAKQKQDDKSLEKCPVESEPDPQSDPKLPKPGAGVGVQLGDFYILVPSPPILSVGSFEQNDGLRLALVNRDRLSQAIIDRNFAKTVKAQVGLELDSAFITQQNAFAILNEDGIGRLGANRAIHPNKLY